MNGTEYHNPANLTAEQIGEGYELLKKDDTIQEGDEFFAENGKWSNSVSVGRKVISVYTYRRRKKPALVIEPGKFYRTRDGRKARVYATDGRVLYIIHGAVLTDRGWMSARWKKNGRFCWPDDHIFDLIAHWIDLHEVDWSKLPDNITCVTVDKDGDAWAWTCEPDEVGIYHLEWCRRDGVDNKHSYRLFPGTVTFTGDWTQSKVCRPEGGVK